MTTERYFSQKKKRSSKLYKKYNVRIDIVEYTFVLYFINFLFSTLASLYGKCKRVHWNETEKIIVLDSFGSYISTNKLPSLHEIQKLIKKNLIDLKRRTAATIKTWLMNQKQKQKYISKKC